MKRSNDVNVFLRSFVYALNGVRTASQGRNFRVQAVIGVLVTGAGLILDLSRTDWIVVGILFALVLGFETLNTALENLVNLVCPEYHPLAGKVKDLAAAAVLIISIGAAVCGVIIFLPYLVGNR